MHSILVVDDEPLIAQLLQSFLEKSGFAVIKAESGEEAIAALQSHAPIDLMILDLKMPRISGADVIKKMAELNRATPLIILSGSPDALRHLGNFSSYTEDDIMYKPLDLFALLDKINRKLAARHE